MMKAELVVEPQSAESVVETFRECLASDPGLADDLRALLDDA